MEYDLRAVHERVRNAPWWKKTGSGFFESSYINVGLESSDHGKGIEVECNIFTMNFLGIGATFDEAFADLESKIVSKKPNIIGDEIHATV